jgi:hypothetical protein
MAVARRILIIATSVFLLFILVLSLLTSLKVRAPPRKIIQVSIAQAQKLEQSDRDLTKGKAKINGSGFDRASIYPAPTVYLSDEPTQLSEPTSVISLEVRTSSSVEEEEGMIGPTITHQESLTSVDGGYTEPKSTSHLTPSVQPSAAPPNPSSQLPIIALIYTSSSGPKHCRGNLIQKLELPDSAPSTPVYKNGTCVSLPAMARCGVFFAGKEAGCQADLFNEEGCVNHTTTYVNTVVFMPEERAVGAYWRSMWVRCGIENLRVRRT